MFNAVVGSTVLPSLSLPVLFLAGVAFSALNSTDGAALVVTLSASTGVALAGSFTLPFST